MTIPAGAWPLILFAAALFFFSMVRLGIVSLQRDAFALFGIVFLALLLLLVDAYRHSGVNRLESVDVCTPPASAWPRAPQPTANLAGCANYVAPAIDPARDIPETTVPRGGFAVPSP